MSDQNCLKYDQAKQFMKEVSKGGSSYGLTNIRNLMARLGDVQRQIPMIHVAGTNGKGSVCACISSILQKAGYRVGVYSSPAVFDDEEVIQINGEQISRRDFGDIAAQVQAACVQMQREGLEHPSAFEIETAIAFCWFYRERCDFAVIEAGMGGSLDATNIIARPLCSVLTSISRDHMVYLGDTLAEIAAVKAGIIKPGCPCVSASQEPEVLKVLKRAASEAGSKLWIAQDAFISEYAYDGQGSSFRLYGRSELNVEPECDTAKTGSVKEPECDIAETESVEERKRLTVVSGKEPECDTAKTGSVKELTCPSAETGSVEELTCPPAETGSGNEPGMVHCRLTGAWQRHNIVCALTVIRLLQDSGITISEEAVRQGLSAASLPGRFERIHVKPDFYIDGAHNEGAALALRETVKNCFTNTKIVYIIGVLADKEYEKVLQLLAPYAAQIFAVTPDDPRALDGRILAQKAGQFHPDVTFVPSFGSAVGQAVDAAGTEGVVLAFGSFSYLRKLRQAVKVYYDRGREDQRRDPVDIGRDRGRSGPGRVERDTGADRADVSGDFWRP